MNKMLKFIFFLTFSVWVTVFLSAQEIRRIVSLSPAVTEMIFLLGGEKKLVGRSNVCDYPVAAKKIPPAGDFGSANPEQLLLLKPDLVLSNSFIPGKRELIRSMGIRTEQIKIDTLNDYCGALLRCGTCLGLRDNAVRESEKVRLEMEKLKKENPFRKNQPGIVWIVWHSPVMVSGGGSLSDEIIRLAGGRNIFAAEKIPYFTCSLEQLFLKDPDFIVWTASKTSLDELKKDPVWKLFRAVKKGAVLIAPDDSSLQRPGPRIFQGIRKLRLNLMKAYDCN